ncbi:peptidyl-prolyl cis-trans isomerase CYP26-2, chloroplastic [Cucurbita pepo subsp. pepo]|uniref:peptidyl-prolyl cis-trans isomerase CYP26-2, chloroplastic n=1 Tax=Cucurbita pepo subsp. pepo TaxID=3664 RepID=UPI000C9D4649|nr:peptidyl-prolyl cis-trans isomerase CYP26-2, chloroplastic [Cucurbita pepo subsp. pepo]
MLRIPKFHHPPNKLQHPPTPPPPLHTQNFPTSPNLPFINQCCTISRRKLTVGSNSLLLLLFGSQILDPFYNSSKAEAEESLGENELDPFYNSSKAEAEESLGENEQELQRSESSNDVPPPCTEKSPTKRAFLDISIDGQPAGRIIIGLYGNDAPAGVARFSNLVSGAAGVSYRRKDFVKITSNYVQNSGVRSYGVDVELAKRTGGNELASETLKDEWASVNEKCPGIKNLAGTVGIIVRDPLKPPPKLKLVARKGKLEVDQEEVGTEPNGTEFTISVKDSPELDNSTLVIGTVLEGMQVAERIAQVKTVKDNTTSPYFRVAKLIGDKRAVVAERGFNRPYSKVVVTNCGLLELE